MVASLKLLLLFSDEEIYGLWSLTVGTLAFSRLGDISGSGSLARFVAREAESPNLQHTYIDTVLVFTLVFYCLLLLAVVTPLWWFLSSQIPLELHDLGRNLLYISTLILILNVMGVSQMSAVDGLHESDTRSKIQIISACVFLGCCYPLIKTSGVYGYASSIAIQHGLNLILSRFLLSKRIAGLYLLPTSFSKAKLKEITMFGLKIQGQSLAGLFYDPLAKILVNSYAGLSAVAVYDIAYKLASYTQLVLVAACNPLLPILSEFTQINKKDKKIFFYAYTRTFVRNSALPIAVISLMVPIASVLFFEEIKADFITCTLFFLLAWYTSALVNLSSIYAQSEGHLKWNILGALSISIFVIPMIWLSAEYLSPAYAGVGTAFAIFCGSIVLASGNSAYFDLNFREAFLRKKTYAFLFLSYTVIVGQIGFWL